MVRQFIEEIYDCFSNSFHINNKGKSILKVQV